MSDSYTYDTRQDYAGLESLTEQQREHGDRINRKSRESGADRKVLLREADMPVTDKMALAEVWGGPSAGAEFQR